MCLVKGSLSEEDIAEADLAVPHVRVEEYMVAYADAMIYIRDQGLFVIDSLEVLPEPDNIGFSAPLPPSLPHSLIKIRTAVLRELLRQYTQRIQRAGWTQVQIDQVEQDHRDLLCAYRGEAVLKNALDNCSDKFQRRLGAVPRQVRLFTRVFRRSGYHVSKHRNRGGRFIPDWIRERQVPQLADRLLVGRDTACTAVRHFARLTKQAIIQ
ncbi:hypothetical protein PsorP6_000297 [Peronosclerospora sorghi]|uniref:Uncharacterized protein n=1 Tax=Peronosclerospora sorghi TaxID=230839 RepID=A0ACC0WYI5_9STRA|nr:hypothetical protein PsorP6_000297 [Peronosclerospora sorghi]